MAYKPAVDDSDNAEIRLTKAKIDTIEKYWNDSQARIEATRKAIARNHEKEIASLEKTFKTGQARIQKEINQATESYRQALNERAQAEKQYNQNKNQDTKKALREAEKAVSAEKAYREKLSKDLANLQKQHDAAILADKKKQESELYQIQLTRYKNISKMATLVQQKEYEQEIENIAKIEKAQLESQIEADKAARKRHALDLARQEKNLKQALLIATTDKERETLQKKLNKVQEERLSIQNREDGISKRIAKAESDILYFDNEASEANKRKIKYQEILNARLESSVTLEEKLRDIQDRKLKAQEKLAQLETNKRDAILAINSDDKLSDKQKEAARAKIEEEFKIQIQATQQEETSLGNLEGALSTALITGMRNALTQKEFVEAVSQKNDHLRGEIKALSIDLEAKKAAGASKEVIDAGEKKLNQKKQQLAQNQQDAKIPGVLSSLITSFSGFTDWFSSENRQSLREKDAAVNAGFGAEFAKNITDAFGDTIGNLGQKLAAFTNQIDSDINSFYELQAHVEARLQGSNESYQDALKTIKKSIGLSGYVSQKEVIDNIVKASDQGIAYNLELRAFLATVADDIANTFNALDATLLRIVRLQQADTTAARLGMEASLTKFFNNMYSDTAYLTNMYDTISNSIIDANSQMSRDQSIEFEYQVQKWLGSLYEVGMSDSAVNKIAEGLNYLATGNVSALNSNNELQTLLALSSQKAGLDYASLLTNSLTGSDTNKLLKAMVEYLKEIAESSADNKVVENAWANNVFGMSLSDFRAITNLAAGDINNIASSTLNYSSAMSEINNQLGQITKRVHLSQVLDTAIENAMATSATTIGNNIGLYATWKVLNIVEDLTGGIAIPGISVFGNMVDLHQTVTGLAKAGIAGLSLMGSLLQGIPSMLNGGPLNLNNWGYQEYTSRGSAQPSVAGGVSTGVSSSQELNSSMNTSSSDMKKSTLSEGADSAEEDSKITNKNNPKVDHTLDDLYDNFFEKHEQIYIYGEQLVDIKTLLGAINALDSNILLTNNNILSKIDPAVNVITSKEDAIVNAIRALTFDTSPIVNAIQLMSSTMNASIGSGASSISSAISSLSSDLADLLTPPTPENDEIILAYASGTLNAKKGSALVGEEGPELITLAGGERIYNAKETELIQKQENKLLSSLIETSEKDDEDILSKIPAYASGTLNAKKGSALVGEEGPELITYLLEDRQQILNDILTNQVINDSINNDSSKDIIQKSNNALSIIKNYKTKSNLTTINKISELETNLINLCDSIEEITSNINKENAQAAQIEDNLDVKLTGVEDTVMKVLTQMIEQKVYDAVLKAMMRAFGNDRTNSDNQEETMLSVLKQFRDNPRDVRIINDNFDSVLLNMLFNANY